MIHYLDGTKKAPIPTYFIDAYPGARCAVPTRNRTPTISRSLLTAVGARLLPSPRLLCADFPASMTRIDDHSTTCVRQGCPRRPPHRGRWERCAEPFLPQGRRRQDHRRAQGGFSWRSPRFAQLSVRASYRRTQVSVKEPALDCYHNLPSMSHLCALSPHRSDISPLGAIAAAAAGEYRQADVAALLKDLYAGTGGSIGPQQQQLLPDLLLTSEWPRGVALGAPKEQATPEARSKRHRAAVGVRHILSSCTSHRVKCRQSFTLQLRCA